MVDDYKCQLHLPPDDDTHEGREERMLDDHRQVPRKRVRRGSGDGMILRAVARIVLELSQREGKREWIRTEADLRALEVIEAWLAVTK